MKISTPIWDFLNNYSKSDISRFHMPGHKGVKLHGLEHLDITEINGADYLYESSGIIAQSEELTSKLFGSAKTLYSTEGSSLSIKTMLGVVVACRKDADIRTKIIAPRNVHRAFINGCALLDIDVVWVYPSKPSASICACEVTSDDIKTAISKNPDCDGVYLTSPDYLGNLADISGISTICKQFGIPLLVDNAHGAYLKFLETSLHPIDLGADMCSDSAHKTLPVYTGGSYLHISKNADVKFMEQAKSVMSMFSSTSPSYIMMSSLDKCCGELQGNLPQRIKDCCVKTLDVNNKIKDLGFEVGEGEPMKITVYPNPCGYTGEQLADIFRKYKVECEYCDSSSVVFMVSPYNSDEDFNKLLNGFSKITLKPKLCDDDISIVPKTKSVKTIRQAVFSSFEEILVDNALGRICAKTALSCQPSIPIIVSGEIFTEDIIKILKKYSIFTVNVIK